MVTAYSSVAVVYPGTRKRNAASLGWDTEKKVFFYGQQQKSKDPSRIISRENPPHATAFSCSQRQLYNSGQKWAFWGQDRQGHLSQRSQDPHLSPISLKWALNEWYVYYLFIDTLWVVGQMIVGFFIRELPDISKNHKVFKAQTAASCVPKMCEFQRDYCPG